MDEGNVPVMNADDLRKGACKGGGKITRAGHRQLLRKLISSVGSIAPHTAKPSATRTGGFAFAMTYTMVSKRQASRIGKEERPSLTGRRSERPNPTGKAYARRGRPQAAFSWRRNSDNVTPRELM